MRSRILICFLIGLFLLNVLPASAQSGEIFMEAGDIRLFLVSGSPQAVRVSAQEDDTLMFSIRYTDGLTLAPSLLNADGDETDFTLSQNPERSIIHFTTEFAGDFFLQLVPESGAGYARVVFDVRDPEAETYDGSTGFLNEALDITFDEAFDDNSREWSVGEGDNVETEVEDGALVMTFSGEGRTFSGFTAVSGSAERDFFVSAAVDISGAADATLGLMLRVVDGANFYLFQVAPGAGQWRFASLHESRWETISGWHPDSRLRQAEGMHTLTVWAMGDVYLLLWDGEPLGHIRDDRHERGGVGVFAELPPGGAGAPRFAWTQITLAIEPPDFPWARPLLADSGQLGDKPEAVTAAPGEVAGLQALLPGEWYWNDDADTQAMTLVFHPDGTFEQIATALTADAVPVTQTGRWSVRDGDTLILEIEGLPSQQYHPQIQAGANVMTIPDLGNRRFVRLPSE